MPNLCPVRRALLAGQHVLERTSVLIHGDGSLEARFTGGRHSSHPWRGAQAGNVAAQAASCCQASLPT
jgi:hypothetical protein